MRCLGLWLQSDSHVHLEGYSQRRGPLPLEKAAGNKILSARQNLALTQWGRATVCATVRISVRDHH